MSNGYSPVVLDSIEPDNFPNVNIYVKQGNNFTLYRKDETELTHDGLSRLRQSGVEFVHIDDSDSEEVLLNVKSNLKSIFDNDELPKMSKNLVLGHIMMNDISDIFKDPTHPGICHRCKKLLDQHAFQIDDRLELLELLSKFSHYDVYLLRHCAQVAVLTMFMNKKLFSLPQHELVAVGVGAMLHDVGMLDVSSDIHEKNGALTHHEFRRVRHHPRHGHDLLFRMGLTNPASLSIVLDHHERFNGTGYPRQLYEYEIPRSAQVSAICDTYCALTTDRPYRPGSTTDDALKIMHSERKIFNPDYFDEFASFMSDCAL